VAGSIICVRFVTTMALGRSLFLALLALLAFASYAEAYCRYRQGGISCCRRVLDRKKQGALIFYRCKQCEDGYVLSDDKTQCVPDNQCPSGTGPTGPYGKPGDCQPCSDDNCIDCSGIWYSCNVCDDNYHVANGGCDQNLLF